MDLVELVFPKAASQATRERSFALCEQLGKTAVEVPDLPGFVVNRLLFPFLFEAVRLREETGLEPAAVDSCLQLGAGHPMGPLALLDLVGLDVAQSIGTTIGAEVPAAIDELVAEGALGRKSGRGFLHLHVTSPKAPYRRRPRDCLGEIEKSVGTMRSATNVPSSHPSSKTLSARLAPLSRALCVSRSILPRISLSPPQPPKRPSRLP